MFIKTLALTVAAFGGLVLSTQAVQAQSREPSELHVSTVGINFNDPLAVKAFYTRLSYAAKTVCDSDSFDPMTQIADRACESEALAGAVASAHNDSLLAYASQVKTIHRLTPFDGFKLAMLTGKK